MDKRKTRKMSSPAEWMCPIHKKTVRHIIRTSIDDRNGKSKYCGEYFGCPDYHECKYYVSPNGDVPVL